MDIIYYIYSMNSSTSYNTVISLPMYPFSVMVSLNETDDKLKRTLKRRKIAKDSDISHILDLTEDEDGRSCILENKFIVIRLKTSTDLKFNIRLVSHEVFHAVCFLMEYIGVQLEVGKSDEQYAYLIDYLTGEIMEIINKKLKV